MTFAQQGNQFGAQSSTGLGIDGAIDGLVRNSGQDTIECRVGNQSRTVHARQFASNLLRRPVAAQFVQNCTPKRRLQVGTKFAPGGTSGHSSAFDVFVGKGGTIKTGGRYRADFAPIQLLADGAATEIKPSGDFRGTGLGLQKRLNRDSVSLRDVRVVCSHRDDTLQGMRCRTSNLSQPSDC